MLLHVNILLERFTPWRRAWQPTPVFLPGESRGQRSLAGCSPWGRKNWTRLKWQNTHTEIYKHKERSSSFLICVHQTRETVLKRGEGLTFWVTRVAKPLYRDCLFTRRVSVADVHHSSVWTPRSRGLSLFSRKEGYLLRTEHLLCVGCARSWEIFVKEKQVLSGIFMALCSACFFSPLSGCQPSTLRTPISNRSQGASGPWWTCGWWEPVACPRRPCVYSLS